MSWFFDLLSAALYAVFLQNLLFSGGFGSTEAIRTALTPRRLILFAGFISYFSILTSAACRMLDGLPAVNALGWAAHTAVFTGVLAAVYLATACALRFGLKASRRFLTTAGIAALNSLVLALPLMNRGTAAGFADSVGTGLGSGLAFILAVALINAGLKTLAKNKNIPRAFRGTPVMFVYVALLALALSGFSGGRFFNR